MHEHSVRSRRARKVHKPAARSACHARRPRHTTKVLYRNIAFVSVQSTRKGEIERDANGERKRERDETRARRRPRRARQDLPRHPREAQTKAAPPPSLAPRSTGPAPRRRTLTMGAPLESERARRFHSGRVSRERKQRAREKRERGRTREKARERARETLPLTLGASLESKKASERERE